MSQPRLAQRALPTQLDEGSGLAGKRRLYLPNKRLVLVLQSRHPPSQQLIKLLNRCITLGGKTSELGVHGSTDSSTDCDSDYEDCEETYYCEPWDEYCLTDCEDDGTCDDFNIEYLSTTGYVV